MKTLQVETEPDSWPQNYFSKLREDFMNTYESATSEEKIIQSLHHGVPSSGLCWSMRNKFYNEKVKSFETSLC